MQMGVEGRRSKGKLKNKQLNVINYDMITTDVYIDDMGDYVKQRFGTRMANSGQLRADAKKKNIYITLSRLLMYFSSVYVINFTNRRNKQASTHVL